MKELYKRYRPSSLKRVVGNTETVATLQNMLTRGTLPHTILLHGPSGCGKTTIGRILRKELKCSDNDYKEMNCSDFRGIDTIRELSRNMTMAPIGGDVRVFLLDEVHQMSKDAQNAALKILEDTPKHVYFFLCTTDPQKLIETVRKRATPLPVRLLTPEEATALAKRVMEKEKITLTSDVLEELVEAAQGSARTVLVLLDKLVNLEPGQQLAALKQKTEEEKESIELCRALLKKEGWPRITGILRGLQEQEPESIRWAVLGYARSVLLNKKDEQAYLVIRCFENHFYDSKHAGLIRACFEAVFGE